MSTAGPGETPDLLTIGELARWANVPTTTLRHYEDLGLLDPAEPPSDLRRYAASTVGLVEVILLLQEVGFTPREIRELIDARAGSPRSWRQLAERKITALDRQIEAARLARAALDHALGCEHDAIVDCPGFLALVADRRAGRPLAANAADTAAAADAGTVDETSPDPPAGAEQPEPTRPAGPLL